MLGERYGRLTVIKPFDGVTGFWVCICACGSGEKTVRGNDLKTGNTTSCGCLSSRHAIGDRSRTHGMRQTKVYSVWSDMRKRCNNPNNQAYKNYGGRGIKVCKRWDKFENFYGDMGEPNGFTIERIDVNGNYSPENCKWIPKKEQAKNKRCTNKFGLFGIAKRGKSYRVTISFEGKQIRLGSTMDLDEACRRRRAAEYNIENNLPVMTGIIGG